MGAGGEAPPSPPLVLHVDVMKVFQQCRKVLQSARPRVDGILGDGDGDSAQSVCAKGGPDREAKREWGKLFGRSLKGPTTRPTRQNNSG